MTENIESTLNETRLFYPSEAFRASATINPTILEALRKEAEQDYEGFWARLAREEIAWKKPFENILDRSQAPTYRWFDDGILNVSYNCIDRHLATKGDQPAIYFEGERGDKKTITYNELSRQVNRFANALKSLQVSKGDRVVIYMPMIPEAVIAMQACARIGAIHSVVFGGFSAEALRSRINDAQAKIVLTADGGHRAGKIIPLKSAVDQALENGATSVEKVIVYERTGESVPMLSDRDIYWSDAIAGQSEECEPEWVDSEHPLFLLYTSGSTGKPKGIQHASAGYLLWAILTNKWVFDLKANDVFWCTADVGWITGHTYVTYGPLALGTSQVIYEGAPTYPKADRFWELVESYKVSVFYTAPTAIRALMKLGDQYPQAHDLSSLRLLGSVGEPINPEAWMWYHKTIGQERCPIVDTWWQTETGGHMIAPLPGAVPTKPGSCTLALPGIQADVVDENGDSITEPHQGGYLVIREPWPSMLRTIWGDHERYRQTYWHKFNDRYYVAGDSARRDEDGYFWIMGRIDDVLNVSGHRLGTMEIESALVAHALVAEAAVVGRPHDITGEEIIAFVTLKQERPDKDESQRLLKVLRDWVAQSIGPIARPGEIRFADALPKTRSGKIMRRLLRTIAAGEEITSDISTLENESVIRQLQGYE